MADLDTMFERMRHICERLESENLSLEDGLTLFAQGAELEREIRVELEKRERWRVEIVSQAADGTTKIEPFTDDRGKKK